MKSRERVIAALVAGGLVLVGGDVPGSRNVALVRPASAQSAQPVAPWTWTPAPAAQPPQPAGSPPVPQPTDRAVPPPRAKRPSAGAGSSSPAGRTLDSGVRPAPAPAGIAAPPDDTERKDGSAAIDWLFKE